MNTIFDVASLGLITALIITAPWLKTSLGQSEKTHQELLEFVDYIDPLSSTRSTRHPH